MNGLASQNKPPYRVPSMDEITAVPWNGYTVISTFSGCGGSSLGYKMAGFRVLWASEFVPAAQEVYRLNHPDTILDTRDIRQVQPSEMLSAIGMQRGELDLLDGSPPCASFSTAGKREAGWGKVKQYSDVKQRVDDLFFEYARILEGLQPRVFVAENVSGLVKGSAKGYFKLILQALKDCGYNVKAQVLDAQWLGVPQMRQRLIFVGVRNDLNVAPSFPKPLPYRYTVRDAWADVPASDKVFFTGYSLEKYWRETQKGHSHLRRFSLKRNAWSKPSFAVTQTMGNNVGHVKFAAAITHPEEPRYPTIAELKRICAFPDDFQLTGTFSQQWERLARAVPPVMMSHIAATIRDGVLCKIP
jgi:DNA (cytosine-5)-methyltransferase 1